MRREATATRRPGPARPRPGEREALLRRLARDEIIPRLYAMHLGNAPAPSLPARAPDAEALIADLLGEEPEAAVAAWLGRLAPLDNRAQRTLLTDAAHALGRQWVADTRSFADVTVATLHLHALLRGLPEATRPEPGPSRPRCLLLAVPGEQHAFGVAMLARVLRDHSWHVDLETASDTVELAGRVQRLRPDLVGLSAGAEMHLSRLARSVAAIRRAAPGVPVMVGGPVFLARPELARQVGADATAADADEAVLCAAALLARARRAEADHGAVAHAASA